MHKIMKKKECSQLIRQKRVNIIIHHGYAFANSCYIVSLFYLKNNNVYVKQ